MPNKRPQKPRSEEARRAQTANANARYEYDHGYSWVAARALFFAGMRQQQWSCRAQAARWLSENVQDIADEFAKEKEKQDELRKDESHEMHGVEYPNPPKGFKVTDELSRGYSFKLYRRMKDWEEELGIPYRTAGHLPPEPGSGTFSMLEWPPNGFDSERKKKN